MRARGVFRTSRYEDRPSAATRYLYQLCHLLLVELVFRLQSYANVSRTSVLCFVLRTRFCAKAHAAWTMVGFCGACALLSVVASA